MTEKPVTAALCYRTIEPELEDFLRTLTRLPLSSTERSRLMLLMLKLYFGAALAVRQAELGMQIDAVDPTIARQIADELVNDCIIKPYVVGGRG